MECSGVDGGEKIMGLDMDDKYSGDEASREAEPLSKGG